MTKRKDDDRPVSRKRHEAQCSVCLHADRESIEQAYVDWKSPTSICKEYGLDRMTLHRHVHVLGLVEKRQKNIRAALSKIVEHVDGLWKVSGAEVIAAAVALARINSAGNYIERREVVNLTELFDRMTREELAVYAREGTLPEWFTQVTGTPEPVEEVEQE